MDQGAVSMPGFEAMQGWLKDRKNVAILLLSLAVLLLATVPLIDRAGGLGRIFEPRREGEPVEIVDVLLDRTGLRSLDIFFDRPLGEGTVGDVLSEDPATIRPAIGGTWRWFANNVLRFEPSDGFGVAMGYEVALVAERLIGPGQYFVGDTDFDLVTDHFQVERIDTVQEPRLGGDNEVVIVGNVRFNYPVEPTELATRLRLIDPLLGVRQPVNVGVETYYRDSVLAFRSDPIRKEAAERELRLEVRADLTPAEGNVPLGTDFVQPIMIGSREILQVWEVVPEPVEGESRLRIRLSSPVDPQIAADFVGLEPQVDYRLTGGGNDLVLAGDLVPGDSYTLTIAAGLPATDDASLREAFASRLRMPDLEPTLRFQSAGMFLSSAGSRRLVIESINVERADLVVERVYRNNLHSLFQSSGYSVWQNEAYSGSAVSHWLGDRIAEETLELGGERNRRQVLALELDRYVADAEPGLYRIALARPGTYTVQQRWLLITDLGVVAKVGGNEVLAWVASFDDLRPIGAAQMALINNQNQVIARGRTDAAGRWSTGDLRGALRQQQPFLLVAENGGDFSFVLLDEMRVDPAGLDVGGARAPPTGYEAYLYGERDIYRPGETVEGVAVLRDRGLQPPPAMPLELRHRDPEGLERGSQRVESDAAGMAPYELEIPDYARTGNHTLELLVADEVIGRYRFQVEEFVPDRIRVAVSAGEAARLGSALEFDVESAYLFGPPAAGLSVEGRVRLETASFAPAGFEGYSFTNPERDFSRREVFSETAALDDQGQRTFSATLPDGLRVPSSLTAVITARVQEQGGRGVFAQQAAPVHPYPYYVGLRRVADSYAEPNQPETFQYVAVDPGGAAATASTLRVELFKDEWNTVLRRAASGNFRYESTRVSQLVDSRIIAPGTASGSFELTAADFGAYRVMISDPETGASAQVSFYASGFGYSPWAIENPARIELELDRDEYRPGETALVQVRSPFAGKLFLTVERDDVYTSSVHVLDGNTATLELPVPEVYRPNAYVTATVVRAAPALDPTLDSVARAYGAVPIYVDRAANRLDVSIEAADEIRPGSSLQIGVQAAANASLTVAAVDEGILQLINQATPDPFSFFYRKLALAVRGADNFSLLLPEVVVEGAAAAGGGDTVDPAGQYVRTAGIRRVRPVAFWSGVVRADASGRASVSFDVPDFQGALRIMAVAHAGRRFGAASSFTRVRDPLVLLPTFPRFLSLEETARIPVTVRNDTGGDGEFTVALTATGAVAAQPPASVTARVAEGTEQTVYLQVTSAAEPGEARLDLVASGNGETTRAGVDLAVQPDLPVATDERLGNIAEASTTLEATATAEFRPGTISRTLRLSRLPLVQFAGQLRYLVQYPYGCLEQITSRAMPLVYLGDLAREIDPELFTELEPAAMVQDAIRRLATLQHFTGGFVMWPNSPAIEPWSSIYATHFLVEARRGGFLVPDYLYDRALGFLSNEARARQSYAGDELERVVYALYVMARAGGANLGTMDFVRERHLGSLRPQSRALLAGAYAAMGRADVVGELTAGLADVERVRRQTGGNFDSEVRNRALLLLGLLDAAPGDGRIAGLAQRLARDAQTNRYWNTQESSFVLLALGELFRRQAERPAYAGAVTVGGQQVGRFEDRTEVFDLPPAGEVRVDMDPGYEAGSAFYTLRTRGVPTDAAFQPLAEGLELRTELRQRDGGVLDRGNVRQGDLVVLEVGIRSVAGALENVAVQILLPAGFEVENPRLSTRETLPWISSADLPVDFFDFRDDQVLLFLDLPDQRLRTGYVLLRAVTPGTFRLPPIQAEAMYEPAIRAVGERGTIEVRVRQ